MLKVIVLAAMTVVSTFALDNHPMPINPREQTIETIWRDTPDGKEVP